MQSHLDFFLVCLQEILGPLPASLLPTAPALLSEGGLCSEISCFALAPGSIHYAQTSSLNPCPDHNALPSPPATLTHFPIPLPSASCYGDTQDPGGHPHAPLSDNSQQGAHPGSPWLAGGFWSPGQHHKEPSNSPFYSRTPQIYFGRSSTYY